MKPLKLRVAFFSPPSIDASIRRTEPLKTESDREKLGIFKYLELRQGIRLCLLLTTWQAQVSYTDVELRKNLNNLTSASFYLISLFDISSKRPEFSDFTIPEPPPQKVWRTHMKLISRSYRDRYLIKKITVSVISHLLTQRAILLVLN